MPNYRGSTHWLIGWPLLFLFFCLSPVNADEIVKKHRAQGKQSALGWLQAMEHSFYRLNFRLSMIHLQRNRIQTYSFDHGVVDGKQVVMVDYLSGPVRKSYRINNQVTYVDAEFPSYSVYANKIVAPTPSMFIGGMSKLADNYRFILAGQGRVAGRTAQLVRLSAKDNHRFSYLLWLDLDTSLLLRYDLLDLNNAVVEQMQALQLELFEQPSEPLTQLVQQQPADQVVAPVPTRVSPWKLDWLPPGFALVAADKHRLLTNREEVNYLLLSDGLNQVSVYVAIAKDNPLPEQVVTAGGTAMANHRHRGLDITVVGKIPAETALKLARSLTLNEAVTP